MAPAQQDVPICGESVQSQMKMRQINSEYNSKNSVKSVDNDNLVLRHSTSDEINSDTDFDIKKYEAMEFTARWRWPDLFFQLSFHLVSIYGLFLIITLEVKLLTVLFALATIIISSFGVTAGVHRLWSHRAYRARTPLRVLLAVLYTITGQNDIYTWALDHRVHHKYSETVADPHDVRRGFWFAHVGWLVLTPHPAVENRRNAFKATSTDLLADPIVRIQRILYIPLYGLLNIAIPTWVPWYCWQESLLNSFVISFVTRFTITLNIAFCVNSVAHLWGNKPYDRYISSGDSKVLSLVALGEAWHNYHHVFPWDYRTSELGRLNISTNLIDAFAKLGWAYDLKAATKAMIFNRAQKTGDGTFGHAEEPDPDPVENMHS